GGHSISFGSGGSRSGIGRSGFGGGQRWSTVRHFQPSNFTQRYLSYPGSYFYPRHYVSYNGFYDQYPDYFYTYLYPYYYYNQNYFPEFARAYLYSDQYAYPYVLTDNWGYLPSPVANYYASGYIDGSNVPLASVQQKAAAASD